MALSSVPLIGEADLGLSLRVDTLSVIMFGMVALICAIVMRFSRSYLRGDKRHHVFMGRLALTGAVVQMLMLSGNIALFFVAWVLTSLSLHQLLVFYPKRPGARLAATKKFLVARLGDVCLLAAFGLLYVNFGTGDLGAIFNAATLSEGAPTFAVEAAIALIAVAALLKAAQFPTHGWLIEVMETPTPVSALLHAGILNAGPFLVLRFAMLMQTGNVAPILLVLFGGLTALFASVVLLTQPTVKVGLGYSSAAHMGFSLLMCGLGVYPAAVLHLVGHSFYKAHAFLSSGSVVELARSSGIRLPRRLNSPLRIGISMILAVGIYAGLSLVVGFDMMAQPALFVVGAILVMGLTHLLALSFDSAGGPRAMLCTTGLALGVGLLFFALEEGTRLLLGASMPALSTPAPLTYGLSIAVLMAFALAMTLQLTPLRGQASWRFAAYVHLRNGLYANALFDRALGALQRRAMAAPSGKPALELQRRSA
jgi:NAD(P)H-quinone oxidoreductase subunit 5